MEFHFCQELHHFDPANVMHNEHVLLSGGVYDTIITHTIKFRSRAMNQKLTFDRDWFAKFMIWSRASCFESHLPSKTGSKRKPSTRLRARLPVRLDASLVNHWSRRCLEKGLVIQSARRIGFVRPCSWSHCRSCAARVHRCVVVASLFAKPRCTFVVSPLIVSTYVVA